MKEFFTSKQACDVLDMPRSTLTWWCEMEAIQPVIPAAARGSTRILNLRQVWALGIAKSVRAGGQSLDIACKVAQRLDNFSPEYIEKCFSEGLANT